MCVWGGGGISYIICRSDLIKTISYIYFFGGGGSMGNFEKKVVRKWFNQTNDRKKLPAKKRKNMFGKKKKNGRKLKKKIDIYTAVFLKVD